MKIKNVEFELIKSGKPLVLEGFYKFTDYVLENIETNEKIKARCTTRYYNKSSFELIPKTNPSKN